MKTLLVVVDATLRECDHPSAVLPRVMHIPSLPRYTPTRHLTDDF